MNFRPLNHTLWPQPFTKSRVDSAFKATYSQTLKELERELDAIYARNVVLHVDVSDANVRLDGKLRADARPNSPAVLLTFNLPGGDPSDPMLVPCDQYTHWHANLRAITKALEALRGVDRWGVTRHKQQYKGFARAIPGQMTAPVVKAASVASWVTPAALFASREEAARFLAFAVESSHWKVDLNNTRALAHAKELALEHASSPEQRALVKAAIAKIEQTS